MSDTHIQTKKFPPAEAQERLSRFAFELEALVERYELHGLIYSASVSVQLPEGDDQGGARAESCTYGCVPHSIAFMGRFLVDKLELGELLYFVSEINKLAAMRQHNDMMAAIAEVPKDQPVALNDEEISAVKSAPAKSPVAQGDLLQMPLPKGKKWKN